jgi:hypothetical protein
MVDKPFYYGLGLFDPYLLGFLEKGINPHVPPSAYLPYL